MLGWAHFILKRLTMKTEKRKITILGKPVDIAFNMATQVAYEGITGKAFDTDTLDKTSNTLALYYACILANNPDTDITFDNLLEDCDAHDIMVLREAVIGSFTDWCKSAFPDDGKKKKGTKGKNS